MKLTTRVITRSAIILALAIVIQSIRLPQPVTGPLVNTILLLAAALVGPASGILVGLFTPLLAFVFGIMPLAPAVPVIILGNCTLVLVFAYLKDKPISAIIAAALAKYAVMFVGVKYLLPGMLNVTLPGKVIAALTTPQLVTALAGGVLALAVLKALDWLKKEKGLIQD